MTATIENTGRHPALIWRYVKMITAPIYVASDSRSVDTLDSLVHADYFLEFDSSRPGFMIDDGESKGFSAVDRYDPDFVAEYLSGRHVFYAMVKVRYSDWGLIDPNWVAGTWMEKLLSHGTDRCYFFDSKGTPHNCDRGGRSW